MDRPRPDSAPQLIEGTGAPPVHDFRELYEENIQWVWYMLRRLSVPEKDVMDVAQNVFVVAYRKLPEFEGRSTARTWLRQIARRVASDYRRSAAVRREVHTETSEFDALSAHSETAEQATGRAEGRALLHQILESMPDAQREVFIMFELEQLSGAEIAEELGAPLGTIRSRLRLSREAFHSAVGKLQAARQEQEAG